MKLDRIRDGDGQLFYPSGRVALTVCKTPDGCFHTFTADTDTFRVLAMLDTAGVGSVNRASGQPWLVLTREGWTLSNTAGSIVQRGTWPRPASDPAITLEVTPNLVFTFKSKQQLTARVAVGDVVRDFAVGEQLKRSEGSYLTKVTARGPDGRLELDVGAIRERLETTRSCYMAPGPAHMTAVRPGLGNLRSMVASMTPGTELAAAVADLDRTQARLHALGRSSSSSGGGGGIPADLGSPTLSDGQRKLAARLARASGALAKQPLVVKRRPLQQLSLAEFDQRVVGPGAPGAALCVVCVLASWNPVCGRLEHGTLQRAAWDLAAEAGAGGKGGDAGLIQLFRFDAANGTLQKRYGFRYVPFFLHFFRGKLVGGTDAIRSSREMREGALAALAAGRRGEFRPEAAGFAGADNTLLDDIQPGMSLLAGVAAR